MEHKKIKSSDGVIAVGTVTIRAYKAGTKELVTEIVQRNLVMEGTNTGKALLAQRLVGDNTYSCNVNYGAIGSGTNAPNASDTQLQTEVTRTIVANSQVLSNSIAKIQFFFADGLLANGSYTEFGMFIDGTASANSGQIFNRALFSPAYTKVAGTDTTVEVDVEFT